MNPGDTIMCEEFTYPHMIESFVMPKGFKVQGISTDEQGIIPEAFSKVLEAGSAPGGKPPRLLYTVPVGQNPTGRRLTFYAQTPPLTHPPPLHPSPRAFCCGILPTCVHTRMQDGPLCCIASICDLH